ncbi:lymphocyte antigen 6E-like [Rhineura floridana]|uniref:lymphocyte antigen 6E-like n=1 Tax=Rhineura floridana TaxID=261503 RepID=UPI002AC870B7|nr:lymphocyte antigen 6E-like [Rhineura floridana]
MKSYLIVLLGVLLLCTNQVHLLVCFTCEKKTSNWSCLKPSKCSENDKHCVTTVASFGVGLLSFKKKITKKCSPTCLEADMDLGMASYGTSCCQSFLCNIFGHVAPKTTTQ